MVKHVDLRVNNIDNNEMQQLNSLLETLKNKHFRDHIVRNGIVNDYIVTITPGRLQEIKDALRLLLQIVQPERIAIEP